MTTQLIADQLDPPLRSSNGLRFHNREERREALQRVFPAFVRPHSERSPFPWFTLRDRADMNRFRPRFADPDRPDNSVSLVQTPAGEEFHVTDPALGHELSPAGTRVIKQGRGVFDTFLRP